MERIDRIFVTRFIGIVSARARALKENIRAAKNSALPINSALKNLAFRNSTPRELIRGFSALVLSLILGLTAHRWSQKSSIDHYELSHLPSPSALLKTLHQKGFIQETRAGPIYAAKKAWESPIPGTAWVHSSGQLLALWWTEDHSLEFKLFTRAKSRNTTHIEGLERVENWQSLGEPSKTLEALVLLKESETSVPALRAPRTQPIDPRQIQY